jgi:hypothetical protein
VTGDHIRQLLAEALSAHEPILYRIDHRARCHCGWIGSTDAGEPQRHRAAAVRARTEETTTDG